MSLGTPIEVHGLSKHFGDVHAVNDLSFKVMPGRVTGFLGPNGSGKTTTLRCLLGLVRPTAGTATIGGQPYANLPNPTTLVGAALEATGFHPGRTARNHLKIVASAARIDYKRVDETLKQVGLTDDADRRVGGYSMGMRQRLQLAATLLGDPGVVLLDEPANGLDPGGIAWLRGFLRSLAAEGRTVLVSSHVLSEVEQTVDDVIIITQGHLVRACPLEELTASRTAAVIVRTPEPERLAAVLRDEFSAAAQVVDGGLSVIGLTTEQVGHSAHSRAIELHELRDEHADLEQIFLALTSPPAAP
jgi:ABC-2 type transport system ATP-binding protein